MRSPLFNWREKSQCELGITFSSVFHGNLMVGKISRLIEVQGIVDRGNKRGRDEENEV
jgi:hypothetical protein